MAAYTVRYTGVFEQAQQDQWSLTGRTNVYLTEGIVLYNGDRYADQIWVISGGISAQQLAWAPLGTSAPAALLVFHADMPCDLRTNADTDTNFLSGVQYMVMNGHISHLYVTTGSAATTIRIIGCGGSNASVQVTAPLP